MSEIVETSALCTGVRNAGLQGSRGAPRRAAADDVDALPDWSNYQESMVSRTWGVLSVFLTSANDSLE
jgi:hypothetical protein